MARAKYDWQALEAEFLNSDYQDVAPFIKEKLGKDTANHTWIATKTKWWAEKKQWMKNVALEWATQNTIKKMTRELEIPMEQLTIAKTNAVIKVINKMKAMGDIKDIDLNLSDLERIIKIIRTEMGLPTTYSKNENLNMEKFEWIHIVWKSPDEQ